MIAHLLRHVRPLAAGILATILIATGSGVRPAQAGVVYDVDTFTDSAALSTCSGAPNDCSLRGAITKANTTGGTVSVKAGTYTLTLAGAGEDNNTTGDLDVKNGMTIEGASASGTTIQAGASAGTGIDRVFHIAAGTTVAISDVTVRYGRVTGFSDAGGGVLNAGSLTMEDATVTENESVEGQGGGIAVLDTGAITLTNVEVSDNTAGTDGGGISEADDATGYENDTLIQDSVISGNSGRQGGGLYLGLSASTVLNNTDVTGNTATFDCGGPSCGNGGGGIWKGAGTIQITGGTISNNQAPLSSGAGILGSEVNLDGTIVSRNDAGGSGGGADLHRGSITDATISDNTAVGRGGGIRSSGPTSIEGTTVTNNSSDQNGGGIFADGPITTVTASAVVNNQTTGSGGGIHVGAGTLTVTNSTVAGNSAGLGGGVYRATPPAPVALPAGFGEPGPVSLEYATVAGNTAGGGSGIYNAVSGDGMALSNTIVADNGAGANCDGDFSSSGYNVDDEDSCHLNAAGDQVNTDPLLGPLMNNGGPTATRALLAGSPAIDAGDPACPPPAADQRGVGRPIGPRCDSGAFESSEAPPATPTPSPTQEPTSTPVATATPTPEPSGTPGPGMQRLWGDLQCDDDVDSVDSLGALRYVAALSPLGQTEPCPDVGTTVDVADASPHKWGDVDCDNDVDSVDALKVLRHVAALPVAQTEPCPDVGSEVVVTET